MDAGVRETEAWEAAQFGNDHGSLAHGDGAVRMAEALTKKKNIGFLHRVPLPLGTVGRDWREGGSDEAVVVGSRVLERRQPSYATDPRICRAPLPNSVHR